MLEHLLARNNAQSLHNRTQVSIRGIQTLLGHLCVNSTTILDAPLHNTTQFNRFVRWSAHFHAEIAIHSTSAHLPRSNDVEAIGEKSTKKLKNPCKLGRFK